MSKQAAVESLLFVAGDDGLSLEELQHLLHADATEIVALLEQLKQKYDHDETCGLSLVSFAGKYQIVTKGAYFDYIKQFAISPYATKLSQATLETLAIIAYKQPITRSEIDVIRGVQSAGAIQRLLLRDLIESKGRLDSPGRPMLYGTTAYFMNYFGLESLNDLPDLATLQRQEPTEVADLFHKRYEDEDDKEEE